MNKELDTALGIIAGAAVGDALGAPLEFLPPRPKEAFATEMTGGGMLKWKPGEVTDDTIMSLAIQDMYLEHNGYNQEFLIKKWEAWKRTNPKDIGNWTYRVIGKWGQQRDRSKILRGEENPAVTLWKNSGAKDAGNGAVMRCMPTSVARRNDPSLLTKETVWIAEDTHPDPRCIISCLVVNKLLKMGFDGIPKKEAYASIMEEINQLGDISISHEFSQAPNIEWDKWNNSGYTVDTVKCAMAGWLQFDSFEDGLIHIVNRGNDADTVGAIAGSLLGAYHGFKSIPQRWWNGLGREINAKLENNTKGLLSID